MMVSADATTRDHPENSMNDTFQSTRQANPAVQDDSSEQWDVVAQTGTGTALSEHPRAVQAEVDRKLEAMRKEIEASTVKAQNLALKELEKKVEDLDREQKAQAEQRRMEREIVQLRENLRNEREARMWDALRAQELVVQESKKLIEALACKQRERDARLQQERDESPRDLELRIQRVQEENAITVEQMGDVIRAQESAIQLLDKKVEEQTDMQMSQIERQRAEYERTDRDLVGLREILDSERDAWARDATLRNEMEVELRDQVHMQELASQELRRLMEAMAREQERDVRLQQERDESTREMERQIQQLQEISAVDVEQMQEVMGVLESAIQELQGKVEEQTHTQQADYERTEREIVELRECLENEREARARDEKLHDEKEEETRDQVLMQELESQELRSLIEGMVCEQRESNARAQQEHNDAAREMERRLRRVLLDIADNEGRAQNLASKLKEQTEHLRLEREKTEHEMVQLRNSLDDERTARLQEAAHAQELATQELNRRDEMMALVQREHDARLTQEHSKVAREIEERLQKAQQGMLGNVSQIQEALRVQGLAVEGLKSQMVSAVADIRLGDRTLRTALHVFGNAYSSTHITGHQLAVAIMNVNKL